MFPPNFNNYHEFVCHLIKFTNLLLRINLKVVKKKKKKEKKFEITFSDYTSA